MLYQRRHGLVTVVGAKHWMLLMRAQALAAGLLILAIARLDRHEGRGKQRLHGPSDQSALKMKIWTLT